ncbi:thioesterase II family protein [Clostridium mediterraneense]|uniref:thioesterase II family protein n=1 Tax=Clostridium mediterraneense TaxID=1805472 RepID=UPI0008334239|nr:thioesterase domain-containing protein [Clostridium mediterraneense]
MRLICLPYAGGSEAIYLNWKEYLDSRIKILPIALKGRGKRFYEELYQNLNEAVEDIITIIKGDIKDEEYAIFGHSMGSLLGYELYYKIREMGLREPRHIFFSGYAAPSVRVKRSDIHKLPDGEFIKEVIELGGTQKEVFENEELLELFVPILRSDFRMINQYNFKERKNKVKCDISVLNGMDDSITMDELLEWRMLIEGQFNIYQFQGGHFFINKNYKEIIDIINKTLLE